jgi:membrane-associated protease RseP (regulator of RpoE activity)
MTSFRSHLLTLAIVCGLSFAGGALSQSRAPTAEQKKQLDAAREDMARAAKRLAELTREFGGQGFHFEHTLPDSRPLIGVLLGPDAGGGVRITGVTPDGAAAGAGIMSGDRLLRIDGKTIEGDSPETRVENARRKLRSVVENAAVALRYARGDRETEVSVVPKRDSRVMVFAGDGTMMHPEGNMIVRQLTDGVIDIDTDRLGIERLHRDHPLANVEAPHVFVFSNEGSDEKDGQRTIERRTIRIDCKGEDKECRRQAHARAMQAEDGVDDARDVRTHVFRFECKPGEACSGQQRLAEAFRWNGLNLASVDPQLGRYFGADKGVLVISAGPALAQLQAGDVIQRVDGKPVETPRAVMEILRDKPTDSTVAVDYLRDRKSGATQIKVPKAMSFPSMPPMAPIPPAPPVPPHPPKAGIVPHAPAGATTGQRRIVMVDKDGQVQTWEDTGHGAMSVPPMPLAPPPPPRVD